MPKQREEDLRVQQLFEAAHKDPQLKLRLLAKPREVAKEWGVELGDREVERLTKLGAFVELAHEAKVGSLFRAYCDPKVCYPSTVWLRQELVELVRDLIQIYRIRWEWVFYPPPLLSRLEDRLSRNLSLPQGPRGGLD